MAKCCSISSCFGKFLDIILLLFFFFMSVNILLIDAQVVVPPQMIPEILRDLMNWYVKKYGDYLITDKPPFFVGLVLVEVFVQWPLAIASIYGILTGKRWVRTTCLVYGVCTATTMVPILADIYASGEASKELLPIYIPFLIFPLTAIGRGIVPFSSSKSSAQKGKKRA